VQTAFCPPGTVLQPRVVMLPEVTVNASLLGVVFCNVASGYN